MPVKKIAFFKFLFRSKVSNNKITYLQLQKMNMDHLLNKPYVNEVTLTEQNLYQNPAGPLN